MEKGMLQNYSNDLRINTESDKHELWLLENKFLKTNTNYWRIEKVEIWSTYVRPVKSIVHWLAPVSTTQNETTLVGNS